METPCVNNGLMALFSDFSEQPEEYRRMRELIWASFQSLRKSGVVTTDQERTILAGQFLNSQTHERSMAVHDYMNYLAENVIPHSVNMGSPRCLGHMTCLVPNFTLLLGELVLALNQNLVKQEASKILTLVEREAIAMMHRLIYGFSDQFYAKHVQSDTSTLGTLVGGGTLSNITALWLARNAALGPANGFSGVEREGLVAALEHYGYKSAVILGSTLTHYSLQKAAGLLGLGSDALIAIPVDDRNRLDTAELQRAIERCETRRQRVIAIIGVAGSTECGSVDPLSEIAEIAKQASVHFHVDAAWGAPLMFSQRHRHKLAGIERADSVTADGHKQLYLPIGTSMLLLREPTAAQLIEKQSSYILREGSGDLGRRSLEGSRAATGLFLHAALNIIGRSGYETLVDQNIRNTQAMAALVRSYPEFELLLEPETNILLYRYIPESLRDARANNRLTIQDTLEINRFNAQLQHTQYERGQTFVSRTTLEHVSPANSTPLVALRAVIANPLTAEEDLRSVLEDQIKIAGQISGETICSASC